MPLRAVSRQTDVKEVKAGPDDGTTDAEKLQKSMHFNEEATHVLELMIGATRGMRKYMPDLSPDLDSLLRSLDRIEDVVGVRAFPSTAITAFPCARTRSHRLSAFAAFPSALQTVRCGVKTGAEAGDADRRSAERDRARPSPAQPEGGPQTPRHPTSTCQPRCFARASVLNFAGGGVQVVHAVEIKDFDGKVWQSPPLPLPSTGPPPGTIQNLLPPAAFRAKKQTCSEDFPYTIFGRGFPWQTFSW